MSIFQRIISVEEGAPEDWLILDVGPRSIEIFSHSILGSGTVLWNGPMGVFEMEKFSKGTYAIAESLAKVTDNGSVTIIGGGDSAAAIQNYGLSECITHVSTGGGGGLGNNGGPTGSSSGNSGGPGGSGGNRG